MSSLRYSKDHEWSLIEGDVATVGISTFAQEQLGDVVFVELPEVGRQVKANEQCAVVESVKTASEVFAPLSGEVIEVNAALADEPGKVNSEPEAGGWFFKLKLSDPSEAESLMDAAAYQAFTEAGGN